MNVVIWQKKYIYYIQQEVNHEWCDILKKKINYCFFFCLGVSHLTVLDEDEAIITQPKNVTVEIGKTAYMSCSSHGDLIQNPTWVKIEENNVTILTEG